MITNVSDKTINIQKLDEAIAIFSQSYDYDDIYLFMNGETACKIISDKVKIIDGSTPIFTYDGYNVYLNERLRFGEVEIR